MTFILLFLTVAFYGGVLFSASLRLKKSPLSVFELERRVKKEDKEAIWLQKRDKHLEDVISLFRVALAICLVGFVLSAVATFDWLFGSIIAVVGALEYGILARIPVIVNTAEKLYIKIEPQLVEFIAQHKSWFKVIRSAPQLGAHEPQFDSREDLKHLIKKSHNILTKDEKALIINGLDFEELQVKDFMTPRSVIDSVSRNDLLGPLLIDELHDTGHSRFPVIDGDIDHVMGIVHLRDLISLEEKKSQIAEDAMQVPVHYIKDTQTLGHALAAFLKTHQHLFIVVNEYRETVGLLSLEDVIEALIGRKIVDEFDAHDDLRAVAQRNPRKNNTPKNHKDV